MAKLYISEYSQMGYDLNGNAIPIPVEPGMDQDPIDFTSGENKSVSFNESTRFIGIHSDTDFHYLIGSDPTATVNSKRRSAGGVEYVQVQANTIGKVINHPIYKLSVIAAV